MTALSAVLESSGGVDELRPTREELLLASTPIPKSLREVRLSIPTIHCGGCLRTVEGALAKVEGVVEARANLTTRSVAVRWRDGAVPPAMIAALDAVGHRAHLGDGAVAADKVQTELIRALAVAGFASANIMLFSVSVWSGAGPELRNLFHLLSALIAFPTLLYSGRVFYRSAWAALRHGRSNMDVPISIGITLAFAMSLYDTLQGGPHAYFDAGVMLLFFLLIGRTLDHVMRARARAAVGDLARLTPRGATVQSAGGTSAYLPVEQILPGMTVLLAAGERVPVDAKILSGASDLDRSLVTGESLPLRAVPGMAVEAGTLNLTAPLRLEAIAMAGQSFLAEMVRLMGAAEAGRSAYRRLADRAAGLYAPVVHSAAFLTFLGWALATGDIHRAITIAVAVLIITCPCALGLAVPIVQVVAARRLFEHGIMVKDGAGLERLAETDHIVFDKTGTLTLGQPELLSASDPTRLSLAAALAAHSRHPHARALAAAHDGPVPQLSDLHDHPGHGIEGRSNADIFRLGAPDWALADPGHLPPTDHPRSVLSRNGRLLAHFTFEDRLRPDARSAVAELEKLGCEMEILSGDHAAPVAAAARALAIPAFQAALRPAAKLARLEALAAQGRKTLMVGDGLNDAPALAAAHVSMAPSGAVDVGRNAADFVFLRDGLTAVPFALTIARRARHLIRQNFTLAILYNAVALPFAVAGFVTPLTAALAMSGSSIAVVANALRLNGQR